MKDLVEDNGKTIEQNNLERKHKYPIGTLVKFHLEDHHGVTHTKIEGTLYVMRQVRDCDGTPLYDLGTSDHIDLVYLEAYGKMSRFVERVFLKGLYDMIFNMGEDGLEEIKP